MLQQTQVATVIPYFNKFMMRFPEITSLATAEQDEVLEHWSGLGYYARGRHLHQSAKTIVAQYQGEIPQTAEALMRLAGIGKSTAHAILSLAYHQPKAICDGNVRRVLARYVALEEWADQSEGQAKLWQLAESLQSDTRPADYTQAIMDLGATLCTRSHPRCTQCPMQQDCQAWLLKQTQGVAVTRFPRKTPKTSKPERVCEMYLLQAPDGRIWLNAPEKNTGIWGGLYQLPQSLPKALQQDKKRLKLLSKTQQAFTHFKLHIQPFWLSLSLSQAETLTAEEQGDWYHPDKRRLPRPAIVDKLMTQLQSNAQESLQLHF
jgi:A/G-specific adenine glycosylase